MKIIDENYKEIKNYDLRYGYLKNSLCIKEDAIPPDGRDKLCWDPSDYEEVQIYTPYPWARGKINIENLKEIFISNLSEECNRKIVTGIDFNGSHYSMNLEDQFNMMERRSQIASGKTSVSYHADGEDCREYQADEFLSLALSATNHKEYNLTYFNALKGYIKSMDSIDDVVSCYYGMEIPEEYQTDELKKMLASQLPTS